MTRLRWLAILLAAGCAEETFVPGTLTPVNRVVIEGPSSTLLLGDSVHLTAKGLSADNDTLPGRQVEWSSSSPDHLIVTPGGAVIALSAGDAAITASIEGKTASVTLSAIALSFTSLSAGANHACGITSDGESWCWGSNLDGKLGVDSPLLALSRVPRRVVGNLDIIAIRAGDTSTCGLVASGEAWCWGGNDYGQLGDGTTNQRDVPVPVQGGLAFSDLSQPRTHMCGILGTGGERCWGLNTWGQVGDGTYNDRLTPVPVLGGHGLVTVSTSEWGVSCGLDAGGAAWCWGDDSYASLGHDTTYFSTVPTPVAGGHAFQSIAARSARNCGLDAGGVVYCWGTRRPGYVGVTLVVPTADPQVPTMVSITEGGDHTCGLTAAGQAWCWGGNDDGQLGIGSIGEEVVDYPPSPVAGGLLFTALSAGDRHTCGIDSSNNTYCWGHNVQGSLGTGNDIDSEIPAPMVVGGGFSFTAISAGAEHTCGLTSSGTAYCWGLNSHGQAGDGHPTFTLYRTPTIVGGGMTFESIVAGDYHSCGLVSGAAWCWGGNYYGELGDGTLTGRRTPAPVTGGLGFTRLATGRGRTCGLEVSGAAHCWGENRYGALGDGSETQRLVPTPVAGGLQFADLAGGDEHMCGRNTQGVAYCWGNNRYGTLGNGVRLDSPIPVSAAAGLSFVAIGSQWDRSCAITQAGDAYCWPTSPINPDSYLVPGGIQFAQLSVGRFHNCGLTSSGEAYCWGSNIYGQLGNENTFPNHSTPTAVAGGLRFSSIAAGGNFTCGITLEGVAYCWGKSGEGQLGASGYDQAYAVPYPVKVKGQP